MKNIYIIIGILFSINCSAQNKQIKIMDQDFIFKNLHIDSLSRDVIEVYRDGKKILTHTAFAEDGDCSSISYEIGSYKISGNQILFYTYWTAADRQGLLIYPSGVRKQIYNVMEDGKIKLSEAKIYMEEIIDWDNRSDLAFLHKAVLNDNEKELFAGYKKTIETMYKATFVTGVEKQLLISEVKKNLKKKISSETKDWKNYYGTNVNML